jgi:hypothetical protein
MIKPAPLLIRLFLRASKSYGITMPWRTISLMPALINNASLIRHEQVHVMQIERDGAWTWTFKYLYYLARYGYNSRHPYEEEARRIARE